MVEYQINENVVLVPGAVNGAIYDFNTNKIFSINNIGLNIVLKYIEKAGLKEEEKEYLDKLINEKLISNNFSPYQIKEIPEHLPKLEMAWLELTEACNLRCIHCYEGECHHKFKESLTFEKWLKIIDELDELKVKRIILIGGEPCCYPRITDIVKYCGTKSFETTLFTNATNMTDELIECIKNAKVKVKISIYGGCSDSHDRITTINGSFKKMNENILKMRESGIPMSASVILMKENQCDLDNIKEYLKSVNVSYRGYDLIRNVFGGTQSKHTPCNEDIIFPKFFHKPSFKADFDFYCKSHFVNSCWFGKIAIQENGNVLPCVFHRDVSIGNVKNYTIKEIIKSNETRKFWNFDYKKVNECCSCEYRYACKDCRVLGIGVCGNDEQKNPRCLYNPLKGLWSENPLNK